MDLLKKLWRYYKLRGVKSSHKHEISVWQKFIQDNRNEILALQFLPKKTVESKVLWQYWGQGLDNSTLPEIVQVAFDSVDRWAGQDFKIIRLNDRTMLDYLDFPGEVMEMVESGALKRTHFSDLLRTALLAAYGGWWLDATVFLSAPLPIKRHPFFYYRNPGAGFKKEWENTFLYYWGWHPWFAVKMLSSIMYSPAPGADVFRLLANTLALSYIKKPLSKEYFTFQIMYEVLKEQFPEMVLETEDDTLPHLLQNRLGGGFISSDIEEILKITPIHKLTYFPVEVTRVLREKYLSTTHAT